MATADRYTTTNKCVLENTFMYTYYTKRGLLTTLVSFKVMFQKYLLMKDNIVYTKPLSYEDWKLYVLKRRKALTLTLRTVNGGTYEAKCCIRYKFDSTSRSISANKISDEEYIIELSPEIIHDTQNEFIVDGCLFCEIDFVFGTDSGIIRPTSESRVLRKDQLLSMYTNEIPEETEEEVLMRDVKMLLYGDFSDFKINLKDSVANVNKCIIAARSNFFLDYLKENPDADEINLDTSLDVLSVMVQYMYYGTFYVQPLGKMLEVIKLAKKLQMKRFQEMCTNSAKRLIDESNVHLIKEMGLNIGEDELVLAADEFLARI